MIDVRVRSGLRGLKEFKELPKRVQLAMLNAQRYAIAELKKTAIRETVRKYYLTRGQITHAMRSTPSGFIVSSKRLSLEQYKLSPRSPGRKYLLRGAVKKDSGMKMLGHNAFLFKVSQGYKPVKRLTRRRYPLKVITGPSIAQAVGNDETGELLEAKAEELFTTALNEKLAKMGWVK